MRETAIAVLKRVARAFVLGLTIFSRGNYEYRVSGPD